MSRPPPSPAKTKSRPRVRTLVQKALARADLGLLAAHFAEMLDEMPIGLLLLDWDLRLLWRNGEAANVCAVWNYGEKRAAALNSHRIFRIPPALLEACATIKARRNEGQKSLPPLILSEHASGVHAQIVLRTAAGDSSHPPAFEIQLDYRRPRGDRHRPLSPSAVAMLGRLSPREREVAMGIREGLRTAQIASELRRSPLTIKTQLTAIYAKLCVDTRAEVAVLLNR